MVINGKCRLSLCLHFTFQQQIHRASGFPEGSRTAARPHLPAAAPVPLRYRLLALHTSSPNYPLKGMCAVALASWSINDPEPHYSHRDLELDSTSVSWEHIRSTGSQAHNLYSLGLWHPRSQRLLHIWAFQWCCQHATLPRRVLCPCVVSNRNIS